MRLAEPLWRAWDQPRTITQPSDAENRVEARTQVSVDNSAAPGQFTVVLTKLDTVVSGLDAFSAVTVNADGISQLGATIMDAAQTVRWVAACGLGWEAEYTAGRCELSSPATTTLPPAASGYNASTASDSDQFAKYRELVVAYGGEVRLASDNAEFGAHNFCDNSSADMASFVVSISSMYTPPQGPAEAFAVADAYCPPARANIESAMTSMGRAGEIIPSQA